jgi:hypothetical protein
VDATEIALKNGNAVGERSLREYGASFLVGAAGALLMAAPAIYEAPSESRSVYAMGSAAFGAIAGVVLFALRAWVDRGTGWLVAAALIAGTVAGTCVGIVATLLTGEGLVIVSTSAAVGAIVLAGIAMESLVLTPGATGGKRVRVVVYTALIVLVAAVLVAVSRTT